MISDEAVEAAARVLCQVSWEMVDPMQRPALLHEARVALEAALPHLLASQGCGTGHSADAGSLPALADVPHLCMFCATVTDNDAPICNDCIALQEDEGLPDDPMAAACKAAEQSDHPLAAILRRARDCHDKGDRTGTSLGIHAAQLAFGSMLTNDGGEAVHSPDEREGSRDEPKNDLAHPQKGGEG